MPRLPPIRARISDWIADMEAANYPKTTIRTYSQNAMVGVRWGLENGWPEHPKKVEPKHLRDYLEQLKTKSSATQFAYGIAMLLYLRWAGNTSLDKFRLRIQVERSNVHWLEKEQTIAIIASAGDLWLKTIEIILIYTALRESELAGLLMCNVHAEYLTVVGKGSKGRNIPLTKNFWEAMAPYMEWRRQQQSDYFLIHPARGGSPQGPYSPGSIYEVVARHGKRLGIHLDVHTFRRSCLTDLYEAGMPLAEILKISGHKSLEMLLRYIRVLEKNLRSSMERYQPKY